MCPSLPTVLSPLHFNTDSISIIFGNKNPGVFALSLGCTWTLKSHKQCCICASLGQPVAADPRRRGWRLLLSFTATCFSWSLKLGPRFYYTFFFHMLHNITCSIKSFFPPSPLSQSMRHNPPGFLFTDFSDDSSVSWNPRFSCPLIRSLALLQHILKKLPLQTVTFQSPCRSENVLVPPSYVSLAGYRILG